MALFFLKKSLEIENKYAILSDDSIWRCEMNNKAVELFCAVPKMHNCAQAVADGAGRADLLDEMKLCGGGRAPENICGALHAAMTIAGAEKASLIKDAFLSELGAVSCTALKNELAIPCAKCVEIAAELLEKYGR